MRSVVVALVLVVGCAYEIPGEEPAMALFPDEVSAVLAEWDAAGLPRERCNVGELSAVIGHVCSGEDVKGCHYVAYPPRRHVLVIDPEWQDEASNTATHEAVHWLAQCSGVAPESPGMDDDPDHDMEALWGADGVLARANAALGLPED